MATNEELFAKSIQANTELKQTVEAKIGVYDTKVNELDTLARSRLDQQQQQLNAGLSNIGQQATEAAQNVIGMGVKYVYVNQDSGSDTATGTQADPLKSIARAVTSNLTSPQIIVRLLSRYEVINREDLKQHPNIILQTQGNTVYHVPMRVSSTDGEGDGSVSTTYANQMIPGWGIGRFVNSKGLSISGAWSTILIPEVTLDDNTNGATSSWNVGYLSCGYNGTAPTDSGKQSDFTFSNCIIRFVKRTDPTELAELSMAALVSANHHGRHLYSTVPNSSCASLQDCVIQYKDVDGNIINKTSLENGVTSWFVATGSHSHGIQNALDKQIPIQY